LAIWRNVAARVLGTRGEIRPNASFGIATKFLLTLFSFYYFKFSSHTSYASS
jgi:hypothetical protein